MHSSWPEKDCVVLFPYLNTYSVEAIEKSILWQTNIKLEVITRAIPLDCGKANCSFASGDSLSYIHTHFQQ